MTGDEERIYHSRNIVNLCIDDYDMEKQCGRLYHQYSEEPLRFSSFYEALKQMDELYDDLRLPVADTRPRSFLEKPQRGRFEQRQVHSADLRTRTSFENVIEQRGKDATFIVRVQYRQHSSWQGEITWIDAREREWFGSVLELMEWVDAALRHVSK